MCISSKLLTRAAVVHWTMICRRISVMPLSWTEHFCLLRSFYGTDAHAQCFRMRLFAVSILAHTWIESLCPLPGNSRQMPRYFNHVSLRIKCSIEFCSRLQWRAPLSTLACLLFRWTNWANLLRPCESSTHTIGNAAAIGNISTRFAHIHWAHASLIWVPKPDIRLPFGFMFGGTVWHISCLDSWTQHICNIEKNAVDEANKNETHLIQFKIE